MIMEIDMIHCEKAIRAMKKNGGQNKGRITACERELRKRRKVSKC